MLTRLRVSGKPRAHPRGMAEKKPANTARPVVTLADLAPRQDVTGGSQKRVFGSDPIVPSVDEGRRDQKSTRTAKKTKDLPAKSGVKGGGHNLNDNLTLVRAAKPGKNAKDLVPRSPARVKGGGGKDLEKLGANDNITLVRTTR